MVTMNYYIEYLLTNCRLSEWIYLKLLILVKIKTNVAPDPSLYGQYPKSIHDNPWIPSHRLGSRLAGVIMGNERIEELCLVW